MGQAICRERDCTTRAKTRGWCNRHYLRWWKHGHPGFTLAIVGDDARRFHAKVEVGPPSGYRPDLGECWIWCGGVGHPYSGANLYLTREGWRQRRECSRRRRREWGERRAARMSA